MLAKHATGCCDDNWCNNVGPGREMEGKQEYGFHEAKLKVTNWLKKNRKREIESQ